MGKYAYDEINYEDFLSQLKYFFEGGNTYKSSDLRDCYMEMLCNRLCIDTGLKFHYNRGAFESSGMGLSIHNSEIGSYDELLEKVEDFLNKNADNTPSKFDLNPNKLQNAWGYTFSRPDSSPYFYVNERTFKVWSDYEQRPIFVMLNWIINGVFDEDLGFACDMDKKYLEEDPSKWNSPKSFKGTIPELKNLDIAFMKNGNIKIKTKDEEFWKKVNYWYDTCDPNHKNHR